MGIYGRKYIIDRGETIVLYGFFHYMPYGFVSRGSRLPSRHGVQPACDGRFPEPEHLRRFSYGGVELGTKKIAMLQYCWVHLSCPIFLNRV